MKSKINWKAIEEQILYEAPGDTGEGDGDLAASDYGDVENVDVEDIGPDDYSAEADDTSNEEVPDEDPTEDGDTPPNDNEADELGAEEPVDGEEEPAAEGEEDVASENEDDPSKTEDLEKNEYLIRDFIELRNRLDEIIKKVDEDQHQKMIRNPVLTKAKENLNKLSNVVYDYIVDRFNKEDYLTNLYQFNLIIQAINVNCDLLEKGMNDYNDDKNKSKKHNKRKK